MLVNMFVILVLNMVADIGFNMLVNVRVNMGINIGVNMGIHKNDTKHSKQMKIEYDKYFKNMQKNSIKIKKARRGSSMSNSNLYCKH